MISKFLAVALASSSLVAAQTHSTCNPVKGDKCKPDPAVGGTITVDFTQGPNDLFDVAAGTTLTYDKQKGAVFTIAKDGQAPTITSKKYIFFGRVEVECLASSGTGIVTSSVLQSDDLDEIDWEWLGGDTAQVQTNYFSKGDTTTYDRGGYSPAANPQTAWHTYTIDWTPEKVDWIIDGKTVRTLTYAAAKGGSTFPQTPMQIKLGTWVGGAKSAPKGTVEWAGGYANFAQAPFVGYYKSIKITDYSNGVTGAKSYSYADQTGTYKSIKVSTEGGVAEAVNVTSSATESSTKTGTKGSPTTLSTASPSSYSNGTSSGSGSAAGTGSGSNPANTGKPNTPSASVQTAANVVLMGATLFLSYYLVL
jgi:beta-glucanase (GH16 family)